MQESACCADLTSAQKLHGEVQQLLEQGKALLLEKASDQQIQSQTAFCREPLHPSMQLVVCPCAQSVTWSLMHHATLSW